MIATNVEPIREVLENGRWGTLVPVDDAVALAGALAVAANATAGTSSAERRAYAAEFSPERMVSAYLTQART